MPALFRMSKPRLAEGLVGASGVSIPIGNSKESKESPGSTWPKDIIALEPGETAWDVVLKKIKELSDSVEKEGDGRGEVRKDEAVSVPALGARNKTFCFLVLCQFPRSYFKALLCWGDRIILSPSSSFPMLPLGGFTQCQAAWLRVGAVFPLS